MLVDSARLLWPGACTPMVAYLRCHHRRRRHRLIHDHPHRPHNMLDFVGFVTCVSYIGRVPPCSFLAAVRRGRRYFAVGPTTLSQNLSNILTSFSLLLTVFNQNDHYILEPGGNIFLALLSLMSPYRRRLFCLLLVRCM